jgi:uncharacterized membrane protein
MIPEPPFRIVQQFPSGNVRALRSDHMKKTISPFLWCSLLIVLIPSVIAYMDFSNRAWHEKTETKTTSATVTSTDPDFHNTANYQYIVKGKVYQTGQAGWAGLVSVGQVVPVHYNPDNPAQHTLGNFAHTSISSPLFGFIAIDLMILWCFYLIFIRRKKKRAPEAG